MNIISDISFEICVAWSNRLPTVLLCIDVVGLHGRPLRFTSSTYRWLLGLYSKSSTTMINARCSKHQLFSAIQNFGPHLCVMHHPKDAFVSAVSDALPYFHE
jgi:hypothetical protein